MRISGAKMRKTTRQAGFSLVELLTVVAILFILATASIPQIRQFLREYHIRGALQEVRGTLQDARVKAVGYNVNHGVSFVILDQSRYQYVIEDNRTAGVTPIGAPLDPTTLIDANVAGQTGPIHQLPGEVRFDVTCPGFAATGSGIRFGGLGTICAPGSDPQRCPALGAGAALVEHAGGNARICLEEPNWNQRRTILVTSAGSIQIQ